MTQKWLLFKIILFLSKKMKIFLLVIWVIIWSLGAIFIKMGMKTMPKVDFGIQMLLNFFWNYHILLWLFCYFAPIVIWIYLLKFFDVTYLQPILAITYVTTPILAILILKEPVSAIRWAWIITIVIWVFIVSRS